MFSRRRKQPSFSFTGSIADLFNESSTKKSKKSLENRVNLFAAIIVMSFVVVLSPAFANSISILLRPFFEKIPQVINKAIGETKFQCPRGRDISRFGDRLSFLPGTRDSEFVAQCIPQGHSNYCAKIRLNSVTCTNTNKNSKALPTWVCDFDHTNMDPYSWESYNIKMSNERIVCDNSRSSPIDKDDNKDDVCTPCLLKYFVEPITLWDSSLGKVFNNAIAVGAHIGSYSFYAVLFFIAMALISILIVILQDICGNINFPTFRLEGLVNLLQRLSPLTYQPRYRRRRRKLKLRNIDTDSDSESDFLDGAFLNSSDSDSDFLGGRRYNRNHSRDSDYFDSDSD